MGANSRNGRFAQSRTMSQVWEMIANWLDSAMTQLKPSPSAVALWAVNAAVGVASQAIAPKSTTSP